MTLSLSLKTDKNSYAPGEAVVVTASYADPQTTATVTVTGTAHDDTGGLATATTTYTVVPAGATPPVAVTAVDDHGGAYAMQSNSSGVATLTGVAPSAPSVISGFGGAEPLPATAGTAIQWHGYTWELEDWGTGPGQPKATNVTVDTDGVMTLKSALLGSVYAGSEVDSARGDQGIAGNPSTWGYGTYEWVIAKDLSTLPQDLVLGLFTFWATSKGGPAGQKEIDIEFYSAGTIPGAPAFVQFGYYQDTGAQVKQGVPAGHTLLPGSQFPLPAGLAAVTTGFTWLPNSITWYLYGGLKSTGTPLVLVTATQGQPYAYTQPFGGNQFAGTVAIPPTGKQQTIMNLWCPNGTAPPGNPAVQVPVTSFTYTPA